MGLPMNRYIVLVDGESGGYGVVFPDLPGCVAMGTTIDTALVNAADALRDWTETIEQTGSAVPKPRSLEQIRKDRDVKQALADGASLATVPLIRVSGKPTKANLSLDSGILEAIDAEARRRNLTRSAFVEAMARELLPSR
jgi:predicted RNase H-like HicB family nuclease